MSPSEMRLCMPWSTPISSTSPGSRRCPGKTIPAQIRHILTLTRLVTQGSEVNSRFSLGASLKGVGITVDHSEKVFKSSGTTESRTVTTHDERKCIASLTRHILPEEVQVQETDVLHFRRLGTRVEHG